MTMEARTVFDACKITTLTFDCYGTLIDWEAGACRALRNIYGYDPSDVTDDALIDLFLRTEARLIREDIFPYAAVLQRVARSVAQTFGVESNAAREASFAASLPGWPAFEETARCLTRLARDYRLAIVSNVDDEPLARTVQHLGVPFDVLVTSEQTRSYKPNLAIFASALALIGEAPGSIVHIAEGRCEAAPARAVGMRSIWVNRSARSDDGSNAQPDAVVASLTELVQAIS